MHKEAHEVVTAFWASRFFPETTSDKVAKRGEFDFTKDQIGRGMT